MTTRKDNTMNEDLAIIEQQTGLSVARAPEMILDEAHDAAKALKRVIEGKANKVMFGGEQYLEFEDWQTVGRFYGIAPRVVSSKYVEYGSAQGWEATADAVHVPTGRIVSSADAMCLNDEEKWSARPKYAYVYHKKSGGTSVEDPGKDELIWEQGSDGKRRPKKERMLIGTEQVPLFQLRSMAQTRAQSKALRNALAWVVVLAGYRPTPAEEMDAVAERTRATATVGVIVEAETAPEDFDQQARDLFKTPAEEELAEKRAVLGSIQAGFATLKKSAAEQVALWNKHTNNASPFMGDEASLDALTMLRDELRALHAAAKSREKK